MAGRIITVAQQKGGAGKTTLTAQLAVALMDGGAKVATLDIDPQGSLSLWYAARMRTLGEENTIVHSQLQGWRLKREAERYAEECDYVLIDAPPHTDSESTIAIRAADLVLVPMQPSPMDLWASKPTIKTAQKEKSPVMIVLNRVAPRTKLNAEIMDKLEELEAAVAQQKLGNRIAYAASMLEGLGVVESEPSGPAAKEIEALVREIKKHEKLKKAKAA